MKIQNILIVILLSFSFVGCANKEPRAKTITQLEADKKELMALNKSYTAHDIDAMTYLKKSRELNKKIRYEEEMNGNGHTHTH